MPEQGGIGPIDRFFRAVKAVGNVLDNASGLKQYVEYRQNRMNQLIERWQSAPFEGLSRDLTRYNLKMAILDIGAIDLAALTFKAAANFYDVAPLASMAVIVVGIPVASIIGMHGGFAEGIEEMALLKTARERGFRIVIPYPWIAKIGNNQSLNNPAAA